ncbi:MAG: rRNA adenine N-6-methyltransferase family protein [Candidatus Saccharimonas sp.]
MRTLFFRQYLGNLRSVGAIAPSSRHLARKMVAAIDFDTANVIVEYGPGTGTITAEIVPRLHPDATLLLIETNQAFCTHLREIYRDNPAVKVIHGSAAATAKHLRTHKLAPPDAIISGLPFAALPGDISRAILDTTVKLLGDRGVFVAFQYTLLKRELFERYFSTLRITREIRNLPPAYVFRCDNQS